MRKNASLLECEERENKYDERAERTQRRGEKERERERMYYSPTSLARVFTCSATISADRYRLIVFAEFTSIMPEKAIFHRTSRRDFSQWDALEARPYERRVGKD